MHHGRLLYFPDIHNSIQFASALFRLDYRQDVLGSTQPTWENLEGSHRMRMVVCRCVASIHKQPLLCPIPEFFRTCIQHMVSV